LKQDSHSLFEGTIPGWTAENHKTASRTANSKGYSVATTPVCSVISMKHI